MIKLTYKTLNSGHFNQAIAQLAGQSGFSNFQASYNVAKLSRQFAENLRIAREMYAKWTEEYYVKDENGAPKQAQPPQHPMCPFEISEGKLEEFSKKMEEFLSTEVDIEARPLTPQDLGQVKLSPSQILALEPVFDQALFSSSEPSPH